MLAAISVAGGLPTMKLRMKRKGRLPGGQALIESGCGLILFSMVFSGCLLVFLNTVVLGSAQHKLEVAATAAAQCINNQKYWLSMPRQDYDSEKAKKRAQELADSILATLGMPATTSISVEQTGPQLSDAEFTTVRLAVDKIPLVGGFAPVPITASSAAYAQHTRAYRTVQFAFFDTTSKTISRIALPCYWTACNDNYNSGFQPTARNLPSGEPVKNAPWSQAFLSVSSEKAKGSSGKSWTQTYFPNADGGGTQIYHLN
jgi:hypothetical protein